MKKILLPIALSFFCFSGLSQSTRHLKGSFYFYHDYFAYVTFGVQSNGKVIFCGSTGRDDNADIFVSRYNFDGTIDETFGNKGEIFMDLGGYKDIPVFFKILPDNKIIIGVLADNAYSYRTLRSSMVIIKLTADGEYNPTFGIGGRFYEQPHRHYKGLMGGTTIDDGSIFLLRRYDFRNQFDMGISSVTAAGEVNNHFGNNGNVNASTRKFDDNGMAIYALQDRSLLVTGQSHTGPSDVAIRAEHRPVDAYLMKFTPDGNLDNNFGNNGKIITGFNSEKNLPIKIATDENGKIRIAGTVSSDRQHGQFFIYGFMPNGRVDTTFGKKGVVRGKYGTTSLGTDIAYGDSGRFYLAGRQIRSGQSNVFVTRFNEKGVPDTAFAKTGTIQFTHKSQNAQIVVLPDRRVIVGAMTNIEQKNYFIVTCYLPNGNIDPLFGNRSKEKK